MAEAVTIPGGFFNVLLLTSAANVVPQVFSYLCGFTSGGLTVTTNAADVLVPDCDNPQAVLIRRRVATSEQASMTGAGVYVPDSFPQIEAVRGKSVPMRFEAAVTDELITAGYTSSYLEGNFMLGGYTIGGDRTNGSLGTLTGMTFESDGAFDWVFGNIPA